MADNCKEYTPSQGQVNVAKRIAPHLLGIMTDAQVAEMLAVVNAHRPDLAFDVAQSMANYAANPKKRKRDAIAATATTTNGDEEIGADDAAANGGGDGEAKKAAKKTATNPRGKPAAPECAEKASAALEKIGDRAPRMTVLVTGLLAKYNEDVQKNKAYAQGAYSIVKRIREVLDNEEDPDTNIDIKDIWVPYDTYGKDTAASAKRAR